MMHAMVAIESLAGILRPPRTNEEDYKSFVFKGAPAAATKYDAASTTHRYVQGSSSPQALEEP